MTVKPFVVVDMRTGDVVSYCATRQSARRVADKRDNEYGGIRFRSMATDDLQGWLASRYA